MSKPRQYVFQLTSDGLNTVAVGTDLFEVRQYEKNGIKVYNLLKLYKSIKTEEDKKAYCMIWEEIQSLFEPKDDDEPPLIVIKTFINKDKMNPKNWKK